MFTLNPNTVYTKEELSQATGKSSSTINRWCQNGLKHRERYITGRAVLEYMEQMDTKVETISKGMKKAQKYL